jgi:serine/threonine protein kinase
MMQFFHDYQLIAPLGRRLSSSVHLARSTSDPASDSIAIKIFNTVSLLKAQEQQDFLQKVYELKQLHHPHILEVQEGGIEEKSGRPYLVSAYAAHRSLRRCLDAPNADTSNPAPLPLKRALQVIAQIGRALSYAHARNILHAHLKPENVLFGVDDEVLLADFTLEGQGGRNTSGIWPLVDMACYMAPEQFNGKVSEASDQYALACMAYELLTGQTPFTATAFSTWKLKHAAEVPVALTIHNPALPIHVQVAVLKALSKDPAQRYPDIEAFIEALTTPLKSVSTSSYGDLTAFLSEPVENGVMTGQRSFFDKAVNILSPEVERKKAKQLSANGASIAMMRTTLLSIRDRMKAHNRIGLYLVVLLILAAGPGSLFMFILSMPPENNRIAPSRTTLKASETTGLTVAATPSASTVAPITINLTPVGSGTPTATSNLQVLAAVAVTPTAAPQATPSPTMVPTPSPTATPHPTRPTPSPSPSYGPPPPRGAPYPGCYCGFGYCRQCYPYPHR